MNITLKPDLYAFCEKTFAEGSPLLDNYLDFWAVLDHYNRTNRPMVSRTLFRKYLMAYCEESRHIETLNPDTAAGFWKYRRMIILNDEDGWLAEFIYLKTPGRPVGGRRIGYDELTGLLGRKEEGGAR